MKREDFPRRIVRVYSRKDGEVVGRLECGHNGHGPEGSTVIDCMTCWSENDLALFESGKHPIQAELERIHKEKGWPLPAKHPAMPGADVERNGK